MLEKPADNRFHQMVRRRTAAVRHRTLREGRKPRSLLHAKSRYQGDNGEELFFLANSHLHDPYRGRIVFTDEITAGRYPWVWDMEGGKRWRIQTLDGEGGYTLDIGQADSLVIVFDKNKKGPAWNPLPYEGPQSRTLTGWDVELHHSREGWIKTDRMEQPTDLKDTPWVDFTGTVTYRTTVDAGSKPGKMLLNLGKVYGVAELKVNGRDRGVRFWYGRRVYDTLSALQPGENRDRSEGGHHDGNFYMKTLTDNPTAPEVDEPQEQGTADPVDGPAGSGDVILRRKIGTSSTNAHSWTGAQALYPPAHGLHGLPDANAKNTNGKSGKITRKTHRTHRNQN
ncbi:MAG: hypothetical protein ACLR8Y_08870 [Alistipes indistinctus]